MPDTLPRLNLDDARAVLGKMTPPTETMLARYEHGGGRLAAPPDWMTWRGKRTLIADFYDEGNREAFAWLHEHGPALVEEVAQLRAALVEIRDAKLDRSGNVSIFYLREIARAALSPAPRVNDRGRQQLEQIAALQERHALGQMSDADLAHAINEICNVNK